MQYFVCVPSAEFCRGGKHSGAPAVDIPFNAHAIRHAAPRRRGNNRDAVSPVNAVNLDTQRQNGGLPLAG